MHRERENIPEDFTLLLSCGCTFLSSNSGALFSSEDSHLRNMKHGCVPVEILKQRFHIN